MQSTTVFLDTSALLAILHLRDSLHIRAMEIYRRLSDERTEVVTSEWVLTELLGGAARPPLRGAAISAIERLRTSPRGKVIAASHEGWQAAFDRFASRKDKEWSLVDCSSMVICEQLGISRVFTSDHHFLQAGFDALLT